MLCFDLAVAQRVIAHLHLGDIGLEGAAAQREPLLFKFRCLSICVGAGDQFSIDIDLHHAIVFAHHMRQMQIAVIYLTCDRCFSARRYISITAEGTVRLFRYCRYLVSRSQLHRFILII